jgi:hypothetical protein
MSLVNLNDRVQQHTSSHINNKINIDIQKSALFYAHNPDLIDERLEKLKQEWDIERILQTNASILALFGLIVGLTIKRSWLLLPFVVLSFLLQHSIQGWCPPIILFRRLGIRTKDEISSEYISLLALKGDLDELSALIDKSPKERADTILRTLAA